VQKKVFGLILEDSDDAKTLVEVASAKTLVEVITADINQAEQC
jgi:hypothetical protein